MAVCWRTTISGCPDFCPWRRIDYTRKNGSSFFATRELANKVSGSVLRARRHAAVGFLQGALSPLVCARRCFSWRDFSNGGLIWSLGGETNLQVGATVEETGLHEACRSLLMARPFLFVEEPLAVWTTMPKSSSARAAESYRLIGRGMQSVRDFVLRTHGEAVVRVAKSLAWRLGLTDRLVEAVSYSGHPGLAGDLRKGKHFLVSRAFSKGLAIRLVEKNPCAAFLRAGRPAVISRTDIEVAHG